MVASKRAHAKGRPLGLPLPVPASLHQVPAGPHCHRGPSTRAGVGGASFSPLWGRCSSPLGPGAHEIVFVPSKSRASVSSSPVEVLQLTPSGLQSDSLGIPNPFAGSLGWEA